MESQDERFIKVTRVIKTTESGTKKLGTHRIPVRIIADWRDYGDKLTGKSLTSISFFEQHPTLGKSIVVISPTPEELDSKLNTL